MKLLVVLAVVAISAVLATAPAQTGAAGPPRENVLDQAAFEEPGRSVQPHFIWWWPGAAVEDTELRAEVNDMASVGFGGVEQFESPGQSLPPTGNPPETFMWGTPFWAERIRTAMQAALDNGMDFDLQVSSSWPWASPTAEDDLDLSTQELGFGTEELTGPTHFAGQPPAELDPNDRKLVAVTAAQRAPGKGMLDPASTVDLTHAVDQEGNLHWDVPAGKWVLFGFWRASTRGRGGGCGASELGFCNNNGYVIDHLSRDATDAATEYLDTHLFDRLGDLPARVGRFMHEDSLENFGEARLAPRLFWTEHFLEEFRARRGYDLTRYLPALAIPATASGPGHSAYDFPGSIDERIRHDYAQTLTELWIENHVIPASEWARSHGMKFSGRATGTHIDGLEVVPLAKAYDSPNIDHISNSTIDWVRTITSGARLSGANLASSEVGDLIQKDYMLTLRELKRLADRQFVGGANELELHIYPYQVANGAVWPSWSPWSGDFRNGGTSEAWSPKIPLWQHMPSLAAYFARAQDVLQTGRPVSDVAVYRDLQGFAFDVNRLPDGTQPGDQFEPELNSALTRSGFNFDVADPGTLADRATTVEGRRLVIQSSGDKALVIDLDASTRVGEVDNSDAMSAAVAQRLVEFARGELPIVFVGRFPDRGVSARNPEVEDRAVREAVAKLKRSKYVRLAKDDAEVPAVLSELGVRPDVSLGSPPAKPKRCGFGAPCVYSVHRSTADGEYWFLWNDGSEPARFTASFAAGDRAPDRWDLWSGEREPIGQYEVAGGRVKVPIELASRESTVIGFDRPASETRVESTTAEEVIARDGELFLRSTEAGRAQASLSDGREREVTFGPLPAAVEPDAWHLHVDGAVPEGEETHDLALARLQDWRKIPELEDTSGIGEYEATVTLGPAWTEAGHGAYLELGRVEGGVQVRVNGQLVYPAAVPPPRIDIGPFLTPGENRIEVELSTTLKNRLDALGEQGVAGYLRFLDRPVRTQPYGLIGPVRLVPYEQVALG
jgi:glycosyl hydrolase family 106( putative alpha-L-rhamnosidase)